LSGEITEFKEAPEIFPVIDGVLLTAVVHHGEADWLYMGVIADFFFDKSGDLDRVLLRLVDKRKLSDEQTADEEDDYDGRYYHIEGDYFVLRYSEMCTINIEYIFVTPEPDIEVPVDSE
jgi:hypothetical protein